jgi:hypothetical protein
MYITLHVKLHVFLTSTPDGGEWSFSAAAALPAVKRKTSAPDGNQRSVFQPIAWDFLTELSRLIIKIQCGSDNKSWLLEIRW